MPLPEAWPDVDWGAAEAKPAFLAFLKFLKGNLAGQTPLRIDPHWVGQMSVLQGFAGVRPPDLVLREDSAAEALAALAASHGVTGPERVTDPVPRRDLLAEICGAEVEAATRAAYPRDYLMLGFPDWTAEG